MAYWIIKCPTEKDYKKMRKHLKGGDYPFKQKEKDGPIKINDKDVYFAETIYSAFEDRDLAIRFTLYEEDFRGELIPICSKPKKHSKLIFHDEDDYER